MTIRRLFGFVSLWTALVLGAPQESQAQVFTPSLLAPRAGSGVGFQVIGGFASGGNLAVEGLWRGVYEGFDLGLRAGLGDTDGGALLLLGADYRNPLDLETGIVDLAATGGLQLAVGDLFGLGADAGMTVGSTFDIEGWLLTPYLHPRLALVKSLRDGLDVAVLADLGVDLDIPSNLTMRLGVGFGAPTAAVSVGLAWR